MFDNRSHVAIRSIASIFFACAPYAHAQERGSQAQRAHQHGAAEFKVTLEKRELTAIVEGPAEIILGFEHAPRTDAQKRAVQRARQQLNEQQALFALSAAARCEPQTRHITIDLPSPGAVETHSEFTAEYRWRCAAPAELRYIDTGFLKTFPRARELRAQVVTATGQKTARLKSGATRLTLSP